MGKKVSDFVLCFRAVRIPHAAGSASPNAVAFTSNKRTVISTAMLHPSSEHIDTPEREWTWCNVFRCECSNEGCSIPTFSFDELLEMLEYLIDYIYIVVGNRINIIYFSNILAYLWD